jgi:DNA-3-methyladenine glycosylase I
MSDVGGGCPWPGTDELYVRYHDQEWGVPRGDDRALFEKLVLEGFQAGLSWITILRKREHFREVFDNFEAAKIVRYDAAKIAALMADPGIVRNRLKIEATIDNAQALLKLSEKESLAGLIWEITGGQPLQNRFTGMREVPPETPTSKAISKELKARGFRFVGPTTVYAFMQSVGMVNDHMIGCPRHAACAELARTFAPPARFQTVKGRAGKDQ